MSSLTKQIYMAMFYKMEKQRIYVHGNVTKVYFLVITGENSTWNTTPENKRSYNS